MKQVTQTLRTGVIEVSQVPIPTLGDKFVLVANHVSVISAGTEKTKIDMGKKSLLQKAKARPDLVKQVLKKLRTEGFAKTMQTITARLDSPSPLGYSSAGIVVAVGGLVEGLRPGDRVACAGAGYANHAELVAIPKNLVVKVPENVTDEEAAFTTLGSIALQGVRLAQPVLGETFLVIGLGLLGQIAAQLLRANGCQVIGIDLDVALVKRATGYGVQGVEPGVDSMAAIEGLTAGRGVDGVLICAGTSSNQPIELAGEITREKGRVVVVGAVRMDIPREPYFKKEISIVISRSYGPGRYDPIYEESGNDYPLGYVRFTEQRNMETFLSLISERKIDIQSLITHRFELEKAAEAYELIEGEKREPYLGIVLTYAGRKFASTPTRIELRPQPLAPGKIGISFYGAGNYATATLLPALKRVSNLELRGIVTASGRTAQGVAKQFGFAYCAGGLAELLKDDTHILGIASRHDTHASASIKAIEAGKHVYVEKPLALNMGELLKVSNVLASHPQVSVMVGFNRRFAPMIAELCRHFDGVTSPLVINIRVNAGKIPSDHWIQDPKIGGGRFIGEGCHFVDLAAHIAGSVPTTVSAVGTLSPAKSALLNDNVIVTLSFASGSVASVAYVADGSKAMPKEQIEVFGGGRSAVLSDFKELRLFSGDTESKVVRGGQDKGQRAMAVAWSDAVRRGAQCIPIEQLMASSAATILAVESLMIGMPLGVSLNAPSENQDG